MTPKGLSVRVLILFICSLTHSPGAFPAAMIDYFIPHQANSRIIDYAARKLKVPKEKFIITIDHFSNTSSSTIPLALWESVQKGIIKKGQKIMLVGFGSGFTWGAALIDWTL